MSCGVGGRRGSDPVLLWLWHRPVATAPIGALAWEPPYAAGVALKRQKDKKKRKKEMLRLTLPLFFFFAFVFVFCFLFFWPPHCIWSFQARDQI